MEWETYITKIEPNVIVIRGYPIQKLIKERDFFDSLHLIITGGFPDGEKRRGMENIFAEAISLPVNKFERFEKEDISKVLARYILTDEHLVSFEGEKEERAAFMAGRMMAYLSSIYSMEINGGKFSHILSTVLSGEENEGYARMMEAMVIASLDHGVTPPSVQSAVIAASVRASYEVAMANGISAITDVHGGAGMKAAEFFKKCVEMAERKQMVIEEAARKMVMEYVEQGKRIKGLGHRIHSADPRKDALLDVVSDAGIDGDAVRVAGMLEDIFYEVKGKRLPLNVDGVIGALVADMNLKPEVAKILFIYGRVAGLSAHYFEEVENYPPMRRIDFSRAVYKGKEVKDWEP